MVHPIPSSRRIRARHRVALCGLLLASACTAADHRDGPAEDPALPDPARVTTAEPSANRSEDAAAATNAVGREAGTQHGAGRARDAGSADAGLQSTAPLASDASPAVSDASAPRLPPAIDSGSVPGPIRGQNPPFAINPVDVAAHGFVEEEFFLEGSAATYLSTGPRGLDGKWAATADARAAYKTRLLVRRPREASAFNGTVLVEWLNVTGNVDAEVGFGVMSDELLRGGYAYVGVSVQNAGVDALKLSDGERYATLLHPGDGHAYDIFAQAGAAIGWPRAENPLGNLHAARLVAYGESQSAMRMITFINAVHPLTEVFDGFIVHSRAGWGAAVGTEADALLGDGTPVRVREDLRGRVLQFFTESEIVLPLGPAHAARQPDNAQLRTWEAAGTAHADQHMLGKGADVGCGLVNDGQQHVVVKAALRAMHRWLRDGVAPPSGTPLMVDAAKNAILRDANGNALGGIRTPAVDAPIATLTGEAAGLASINPLCMLFGQTTPFTPELLQKLYPTHADYVDAVRRSARSARDAGFVLPEEEAALVAEAEAAPIPR
ncbi:MAG: hypothetical protein RL385_984 [Pseudomonadota bacterium]